MPPGCSTDDPMCMHSVTPVSLADGEHRIPVAGVDARQADRVGSSVKQNARTPRRVATHLVDAASTSQRASGTAGGSSTGRLAHSSTIQSVVSLDAREPRALVLGSKKVWPQKRGNVGKGSDPSSVSRSPHAASSVVAARRMPS